jgi:hypothetical protein
MYETSRGLTPDRMIDDDYEILIRIHVYLGVI